jgi:hypothetical protein
MHFQRRAVKRWLRGVGLYIEGIVFVIFAIFCENDSSSLLPCCSVLTPISGLMGRKSNIPQKAAR